MKKLIAPLAALAITTVVAVSCTQGTKTDKADKSEETTEQVAPAVETTNASSELPKFSSPEVQKFAEEYSAFVEECVEMSKSGNAANVQELTAKTQEWATKIQDLVTKMTPEDTQLWTEYYTKLAEKLAGQQ